MGLGDRDDPTEALERDGSLGGVMDGCTAPACSSFMSVQLVLPIHGYEEDSACSNENDADIVELTPDVHTHGVTSIDLNQTVRSSSKGRRGWNPTLRL